MKPPAFQFYAQDFLVGTMLRSAEADGAYIRLLAFQWVNGSVPADRALLMKVAGSSESALTEALAKFDTGEDGNLRNTRMEVIRIAQDAFREKQLRNGSKGGRPKTQTKPKVNPSETHAGETQTEPLQSSTSILPPIVPRGDIDEFQLGPEPPPRITLPVWTEHQTRINRLFNRRVTNPWDPKDLKRWRSIKDSVTDEDLSLLERYYSAAKTNPKLPTRKSVTTLLNHWGESLDWAQNHKPASIF